MGRMEKRDIYAIGSLKSTPQSVFFGKCFNEPGLPHRFVVVHWGPKGSAKAYLSRPKFGGAYLPPPLPGALPYIHELTEPVRVIGQIDTVVAHHDRDQRSLMGDNAAWKGICETLTREFVSSAYFGSAALVLSRSTPEVAAATFALRSLEVGAQNT